MKMANEHQDSLGELSFWTDGSKLENQRVGSGVAWQSENGKLNTRKIYLGTNKEGFDAELHGVDQALEIAQKAGRPLARTSSQSSIQGLSKLQTVFIWLDSQAAISRIRHVEPSPGQWLVRRIHQRVRELREQGIRVQINWVPGHSGVKGNERADIAAKQAALRGRQCQERFASLSHIARLVTERKWKECRIWFQLKHRSRSQAVRDTYNMQIGKRGINKVASHSWKILAARYFQLKSGHAWTGSFLGRIKNRETNKCTECSESPPQTVRHLMLDCRRWRCERDEMWKQIEISGSQIRPGRTKIKNLFGDEQATAAILQFLKNTTVGKRNINSTAEEWRETLGLEDLDADEELGECENE